MSKRKGCNRNLRRKRKEGGFEMGGRGGGGGGGEVIAKDISFIRMVTTVK